MTRSIPAAVVPVLLAVTLASCSDSGDADTRQASAATSEVEWPAGLVVVGDGFPNAGDACRMIGESEATVDMLDHTATLVGCPTPEAASALGGQVLTTIDGFTLVSIPRTPGDGDGQGDATVAGTSYNATGDVPCTGVGGQGATCSAGVTRAPDQISVDIKLPDGRQRVLLFDGAGKFITHSSSEADGSAALSSSATREDDWTVVSVGPERYRIPDVFVLGD